jgi:hypothetical protein
MTIDGIMHFLKACAEGAAQGVVSGGIAMAIGVLVALGVGGDNDKKHDTALFVSDLLISFGALTLIGLIFTWALNLKNAPNMTSKGGDR